MSHQDFLATPLSIPAERSPKEPWPENTDTCPTARTDNLPAGESGRSPATFPPTPAPRPRKAASPGALIKHRPPSGSFFLECGGRGKADVLSGHSADAAFLPRGAEPKGTVAGKLHHAVHRPHSLPPPLRGESKAASPGALIKHRPPSAAALQKSLPTERNCLGGDSHYFAGRQMFR
jgi:hypothetical protein